MGYTHKNHVRINDLNLLYFLKQNAYQKICILQFFNSFNFKINKTNLIILS